MGLSSIEPNSEAEDITQELTDSKVPQTESPCSTEESIEYKGDTEPLVFAALGKGDDIDDLPENTQMIHISLQSLINLPAFLALKEIYKQLELIQFPPSFKRVIASHWHEVLAEHGVTMQCGTRYNRERTSLGVNERKHRQVCSLFETALKDEEKRERYEQMLHLQNSDGSPIFGEAVLGTMYIREGPIPFSEIASRLNLNYRYVYRLCSVFFVWLGQETNNRRIFEAALYLDERLDRTKRKLQGDEEFRKRQELRKRYQVGERLPPESLQEERFHMWYLINRLYDDDPDTFSDTFVGEEESVEEFLALAAYYQLPPYHEGRQQITKVARQFGVNRYRIGVRRKRALERLGLPEKKSIYEW